MTMIDTRNKLIGAKRFTAVLVALCLTIGASAQPGHHGPSYTLVDLGAVGPAGQPFHITGDGIIPAAVGAADGTDHAVIFFDRQEIDISKPGLGGANSEAVGANDLGLVVGGANTRNADPNGEDFCGFQTLGIASATARCMPFVWQIGRMIALPTLDDNYGNNGVANSVNIFDVVAGVAEKKDLEPSCPDYNPANLQFQVKQFKPVLWQNRTIQELATVGGDPVGSAVVVNDLGQAAGATGTCSSFDIFLTVNAPMHPLHAVLWERNGKAIDLGSLGGNAQSFWGNVAEGLNNLGHVVGSSSLSDNTTFHAFFWSKENGKMQDLGALPGIANSFAIGINDSDVVVGVSTDLATQFVATIWKHGVPTDLNTLIPANSALYLLSGCSINSSGHIIGLALDGSGAFHGYELIPTI